MQLHVRGGLVRRPLWLTGLRQPSAVLDCLIESEAIEEVQYCDKQSLRVQTLTSEENFFFWWRKCGKSETKFETRKNAKTVPIQDVTGAAP